MDKAFKMNMLCEAYATLCKNQFPTESERGWREGIAGRIDDLSREIILAEEPSTNTKPNTDKTDEIPF